ncbi:MAG: SoxR reducing system RseC family protein [Alphaproteobacteria bacterium]|nr:SoxR reducing system RseC family protein [Alphaproteobacteria bacterium]
MEQICRNGRIVKISGSEITVEIISRSACQNCAARAACGMADSRPKLIEITDDRAERFSLGEEVRVTMDAAQGCKAVWYGYVLPLILVLAALVSALAAGASEQFSGIFSIILLIPYYLWLFWNRKKLRRQFRFTISDK